MTFPHVIVAVRSIKSESIIDCLASILNKSTYPNITVCVPQSLPRGPTLDQRVVVRDFEAVHSQIKPEEFLVWIDGDLQVITPEWIEMLLMYCEEPGVGCASPLIIRDSTVWCSGLVLGMNGSLGYPLRGLPADAEGYAGSLCCAREVSAVSGECLMISGSLFHELGGRVKYYLDPVFDGADLALRALEAGRRNIVTPQAVVQGLYRTAPRNSRLDEELFADRWEGLIRQPDPFYNSHFCLESPGYVWPTPPAVGAYT
jgi:hypothetical protein